MKLPRNKTEFIVALNATEKALRDLVERKVPRLIPGISATLPSPTKPLSEKTPPPTKEQ